MSHIFPVSVDELNVGILNTLIGERVPGVEVEDYTLIESRMHGDGMASTAGRMVLDLHYKPGTAGDMPRRVVMKVARADRFSQPLYANEVAIYNRIKPATLVRAPRCFGGEYDVGSVTFGLILEDLTVEGATFPNVTTPVSVAYVQSVLGELAKLHATFWASPRLDGELSWLETHISGDIFHFFMDPPRLAAHIAQEVRDTQFKREMVDRLGVGVDELYAFTSKVQHHQARLTPTLVHGDTHIGNTYRLADGSAGLVDWQLAVRGHFMHDVSYIIATGLSVGDRRRNERELLKFYLGELRAHGVQTPPSFDETWYEYRCGQAWNVYIGWLTTPVVNYGWEITVMSHLRVMTAFEDLETAKAVAAIA